LIGLFLVADACSSGSDSPSSSNGAKSQAISNTKFNQAKPGEPLQQRYMGPQSSATQYSSKGFNQVGGGPVRNASSDLACNFERDCCWEDFTDGTSVKWMLGQGPTDPDRVQQNFDTTIIPSGNYITVFNDRAPDAKSEAWLRSCSVSCSKDDVAVTFKHWQSPGTTLRVCTRDSFDLDAPLMSCEFVPFSPQPGPTTILLPPDRSFEIVFVAGNLKNPGSLVAIDDVSVNSNPCPPNGLSS